MKTIYNWILTAVIALITTTAFSQGTISGTVVDGSQGGPLPGANVMVKGSSSGTSTDFDGNFTLNVSENSGTVTVSYIGFVAKQVPFTLSNGSANIGTITLQPDAEELEGVVVVGSGVIDLAKERETPVAVSTITEKQIQTKLGNLEFPEILNETPSVYATKQGGGYGDSRINVRGFDQRNTAVIINGQPVNDMENGWVYWSNWQGLADIASGMQVQRGLGASKLAVPSVGGTITIVTKSTEKEEGGFVSGMVGNNEYLKTVAGYNTGVNDKGWAASFMLSRWEGDGYVDGTAGEGYNYLFSLGYKPSEKHAFNFTFTGAAQWHHQRTSDISIRDYMNYRGGDFRKFNLDWGTLNGKEYNFRRNFYNKPIATLNWDWNINESLSVSSSLYGSWGRGGGTGTRGRNFGIFPFNEDLTSAMADGGLPYRNSNGTINMDAVYANNQAGTPFQVDGPYQGLVIGSNGYNEDGVNTNIAIRRSSMNSHDWYGAISNLKYEVNNWTFGGGIDLRAYQGYHYRVLNDLLGLDGYYSTGNENLNTGLILTETIEAKPFKDTGLNGNKIDYYNVGDVKWAGFNGIIEYTDPESISAVLQGGISNQSYKRIDYFDQPLNVESDTENLVGGYVKGGANYNFNAVHNIFFNAGFIARQPNFDAVFPNFANIINDDVVNEKIVSFEVGYGFKTSFLNANLNLYSTSWKDRFISRGVDLGAGVDGTANYSGVEQLHQGIELDLMSRPFPNLKLTGMVSIGDWRYTDDVTANVFDDNQNLIGTSTLYLEDVKVGDAAQFTASIGADYTFFNSLSLNANWRNASSLYADFDISSDNTFLAPDNLGAVELPSYNLFDVGAGYTFVLNNNNSFDFRFNVNNIFDTEYIAESNSNIHADASSETYKGIDTRNSVWFGFGRTWNFSLRYNF